MSLLSPSCIDIIPVVMPSWIMVVTGVVGKSTTACAGLWLVPTCVTALATPVTIMSPREPIRRHTVMLAYILSCRI